MILNVTGNYRICEENELGPDCLHVNESVKKKTTTAVKKN